MKEYGAVRIGQRVAAYRRAKGITAEALAARVGNGMTRTAIAKLENGFRVEVSSELVVELAAALDVHVLALLLPIGHLERDILVDDLGRPRRIVRISTAQMRAIGRRPRGGGDKPS